MNGNPHPKTAPDADIIAAHGLSEQEYALIEKRMGRAPNMTELGFFSVMWSEHCSYKSSKKYLKKLQIKKIIKFLR